MKTRRSFRFSQSVCVFALTSILLMPTILQAKIRTCPPFYLRSDQGAIINPLIAENTDEPYSTRQTCGACHNYDKITKGYHFQQGWDRIRDDFNPKKPWVISDGMLGKH